MTSFAFEVYVHAIAPDETALAKVALEPATLTAGREFACGIDVDGTGYCWGYNGNGQLGDGTRTQRTSPVMVRAAPDRTWATPR